jgi:hypothetical protein
LEWELGRAEAASSARTALAKLFQTTPSMRAPGVAAWRTTSIAMPWNLTIRIIRFIEGRQSYCLASAVTASLMPPLLEPPCAEPLRD